ncbi:MAG: GTP-binding protein, partial [Lachnospiraceae bacterium]|nr:GTP-binding protein [Lachnospiraceae bacterium]
MKKLTVGILAHVDAGKTTLTESLLFVSGMIRKQGRVDEGSAFLDTEALEKKRGVTIHSKQAIIDLPGGSPLNKCEEDVRLTLIDTPGHADFAGEAERSLGILDLAILLISGKEADSDESERFIHLLKRYGIPYVIFVNKMDQETPGKDFIIKSLKKLYGEGVFGYRPEEEGDIEDIAALSEETIESFLENQTLTDKEIASLIYSNVYHPVVFGAASKNEGTEALINLITGYLPDITYRRSLSMRIFRIVHEDGHKLAFAKITGGTVGVREIIPDERLEGEKITQIKLYSGAGYESIPRAEEGDVVALLGLDKAFSGMGIGEEQDERGSISCPVLRYTLILPEDVPLMTFMPHLNELAMEDPLLDPVLSRDGDTVSIAVMVEFQLEILSLMIKERFGVEVSFDKGRIIYK